MGFSTPGYREGASVQPREILYAMEANENLFKPGGIMVDSSATDAGSTPTTVIRAGWPMYLDSTSGNYLPWDGNAANIVVGFLYSTVDLQTPGYDTPQSKIGTLLVRGRLKLGMLLGDISTATTGLIDTAGNHMLNDIQIWDGDTRKL